MRDSAVTIRPGTIPDITGVMAVRRAAWLATYPNPALGITYDDLLTVDYSGPRQRAYWRRRLKVDDPNLKTLLAVEDGAILGFAGGYRGAERHVLQLLYVHPDHHKRGIGGALMNRMLAWFGDALPVNLTVVGFNGQAIRFYRRFGFARSTRHIPPERMFNINGTLMPEVEMIRPAAVAQRATG